LDLPPRKTDMNKAFLLVFAVVFSFAPLLYSRPVNAQSYDDDDSSQTSDSGKVLRDELRKFTDTMKCKNRCTRNALACMSGCANGLAGLSCRAQCQLLSNNCSQDCDD